MADTKPRKSAVPEANSRSSDVGVVFKTDRRFTVRKLAWLGALGFVGVVGWLGYTNYFNRSAEPVTVTVIPVIRGNVEITVNESGTVELGEQQTLRSPREVTVEQVNVRAGDRVRDGQVLLRLRDRATEDKLQEQQVEITKLQLDRSRSQEKIAEAKQKLDIAVARFKGAQTVFQLGAISGIEFQTYRDKLDTANSDFKDAQVAKKKAELDVRKGQEQLIGLQQQLADRLVTAPIKGIVLKVNVKNGDGIKTESNLLTLGDPATEVIKLHLTTLNAAKVRTNQAVRVSTIGPAPKSFTGRVVSLSPQAAPPDRGEGGDSGNGFGEASAGPAKVESKVVLDRPSKTLIPGSQASVEIITDQRQNVVTIPAEALQHTEANPFVWMEDKQDRAKKQPVTLGLQGIQQVEVVSGLNPGDRVILASPNSSLVSGTPLKIVSQSELTKVSPENKMNQ